MTDEEACRVWATALRTLTYDPAGTVLRLIQRWVNR